jgi:phage/plasmid-associated DNA primase
MDSLSGFIAECCTEGKGESCLGGRLFSAYKSWAEEEGLDKEATLGKNKFAEALKARSIHKTRTNAGALYSGIGLRPA